MNCGHLFNGIGGFALAAHWMGWLNLMHCEIDPFCNKVMNYHFPNSFQHEDIRTTDFTIWRNRIDLLTGGFPCQPYSQAGKRKGKEDDRHLWPQMLRAIREVQPGWIVGENVRGLTNWNGGLVFDEVQADLETEGYEVLPFLLPAAGVNAPHRRDRVWFVAYNSCQFNVEKGRTSKFNIQGWEAGKYIKEGSLLWNKLTSIGEVGAFADANSEQLEGNNIAGINATGGREDEERQLSQFTHNDWSEWPTQPPVCNRNDGVSVGLADITFSKWRNESLKALGNAVVPQIPYQIFKAIEQYESQTS